MSNRSSLVVTEIPSLAKKKTENNREKPLLKALSDADLGRSAAKLIALNAPGRDATRPRSDSNIKRTRYTPRILLRERIVSDVCFGDNCRFINYEILETGNAPPPPIVICTRNIH